MDLLGATLGGGEGRETGGEKLRCDAGVTEASVSRTEALELG